MLGNKQNGLLHKIGINGREINFNSEPQRFFKPTAGNIFTLGRKGKFYLDLHQNCSEIIEMHVKMKKGVKKGVSIVLPPLNRDVNSN